MWDPQANCGDLKFPIYHQPGELQAALAHAGRRGPIHAVYQPLTGDLVEHWENVAWMCFKRGHLILFADEVDGICSAGSPKDGSSDYWKKTKRTPALYQIVHFGRHSPIAFIGVSRAPQDVWRRLRGQSNRMLVFSMDDQLEIDAIRNRLGKHADQLPELGQYEYLDWSDDKTVAIRGGKL